MLHLGESMDIKQKKNTHVCFQLNKVTKNKLLRFHLLIISIYVYIQTHSVLLVGQNRDLLRV